MSIFSLVIVGIIAKCIDERRQLSDIIVSLTSISILLELGISVGYFIRVGSFEVGFSEAVMNICRQLRPCSLKYCSHLVL